MQRLGYRFGGQAFMLAREKAHNCLALGDHEGNAVWLKVAAVAEKLLPARRTYASSGNS
jgi:hypothetical protein